MRIDRWKLSLGSPTLLGIFLALLLLAPPVAASAQPPATESPADLILDLPEAAQALSPVQRAELEQLFARPTTLEVRPVVLADLSVLEHGAPVRLELFAGDEVVFDRSRLSRRAAGDFTYFGSDSSEEISSAVLVAHQGRLTGTVRTPHGLFRISPLGRTHHAVVRVNTDAFPEEHLPLAGGEPPTLTGGEGGGAPEILNTPISVLVAYTSAVDNLVSDIEGMITLAVEETNDSYFRSTIPIDLVLAHTMEVSYNESGSHDTDLARLRSQVDNYMDEVHLQRDLHGADVVVLLIDDDSYCGLASQIGSSRSTAFATVHYDCATGNYSFGHEIGHLQSARHDNDSSTSPYAYGHGYYYAAGAWRTIMAVLRSGVTRIQNWSNPDVTFNGIATGTTSYNDNGRVLENTRVAVSDYRAAIVNNKSHEVHGIASCMGESMECEILTHENLTLGGTIKITGGGVSGSWTQFGYRCGSSSSTAVSYVEVYVNDTSHAWTWPTYCLRLGDPFTLQAGNTYDFRGPSVVGADASTFTVSTYTPPPFTVSVSRSGSPQVMTANASGGLPPYVSYAWYRKPVCSGGGGPILPRSEGNVEAAGLPEDVPCTAWYGPFYTSPPNKWTPYQGYNQNIKVVVTDSAGATATGYSWAD